MAKVRMYRATYELPNGDDGYTVVTADNKDEALKNAKKIGVNGKPTAKFTSVEFLRWS